MTERFELDTHPAFSCFDEVMELSGFSGAAIALVRRGNGPQFVRKAAIAPAGNVALRRQSARQIWLRERVCGVVQVPEVMNEGEVDGSYYFDMAFVPSRDANSFLANASFAEIHGFAESVEDLMRCFSGLELHDVSPLSLGPFGAKLAEISEKTGGRFDPLLSPIGDAVERLVRFADQPTATVSHGDLTFENILVGTDRRLWLIDAIQSPVDHYWMDWSKLFQECEGRWYLHRGKPLSAGVTHWLRDRWWRAATRMSPDYAARHYVLLALTFARILPYTKSERDVDFVSERVKAFGQAAQQLTRG